MNSNERDLEEASERLSNAIRPRNEQEVFFNKLGKAGFFEGDLPDPELLDMSIVAATYYVSKWSKECRELNDGARVARERLEVLFYYQEQMFRHLDARPWILATMRAANVR